MLLWAFVDIAMAGGGVDKNTVASSRAVNFRKEAQGPGWDLGVRNWSKSI